MCEAQSQGLIKTDSLNSDNYLKWYDQQIGLKGTELITGQLAFPEQKAVVSHPYFQTSRWLNEDIEYRNIAFNDVSLIYDVHKDLLYIKNPGELIVVNQAILPNQDQVSSFTYNGNSFKYLTGKEAPIDAGFYDMLHEGNQLSLIVKRIKEVKVGTNSGESEYVSTDKYFLNGDNIYNFSNKRTFLKIFPEKKKEIRKYINQNHIKVAKPGYDAQLINLTKYCESIISG